jgi:hypothetical protein
MRALTLSLVLVAAASVAGQLIWGDTIVWGS